MGNNPTNEVDVLGLYTKGDANSSLKKRGIEGTVYHPPSTGQADDSYYSYSDTQVFDEWLRLEKADTGWLNQLPSCPDKICIENGEPKDCDNGDWGSLSEASQKFHKGAKWCMRSKLFGSSAQQCCYNDKGELRTDLPAAGTPDRVAAGFLGTITLGHFRHDVATYNLAEALGRVADYGIVRPPSKGGGSCYKK